MDAALHMPVTATDAMHLLLSDITKNNTSIIIHQSFPIQRIVCAAAEKERKGEEKKRFDRASRKEREMKIAGVTWHKQFIDWKRGE